MMAIRSIFAMLIATYAATATAAAPNATSLFPMGGGWDQVIEVTAIGSFDTWPVKSWVCEPGLEIEPGEEKGQLSVRVSADAIPGLRWIRLYNEQGATTLLPFEVSVSPTTVESEPNNEPAKSQPLEALPIVVDGRLSERGDVDGFAVTLDAGQTLVASLKGHRLGSPMDPVLQVASADGFVLHQSDDEIGLDPQLAFEAPSTGTYIVRCFAFPSDPNSTIGFASGDKFLYRLTLTTEGFLDHTLPLAVQDGEVEATVKAYGWNLNEDSELFSVQPSSSVGRVRAWHPALAQPRELPILDTPSIVEADVRDGGEPQELSLPVSVSGRISRAGETDTYRFSARKGQSYRFQVIARRSGSSLDPVLRILDQAGTVLSEQDDFGRDSRDVDVTFSIPEDGEYRVTVGDLSDRGGMRYFYRMEIAEPKPEFRLALAEDRISVATDKPAKVTVDIDRQRGFDGPIEITAVGLPPGITVPPITVESEPAGKDDKRRDKRRAGTNQSATLTFSGDKDGTGFSGPITIVGRAVHEGVTLERTATTPTAVSGILADQIWLTVAPAAK